MIRGPPVECRVQVELDRVALDEPVAPAERRRGSHRVVADGAEVEVLVVPEDAEGGADGRGAAYVGADLREVLLQRRTLPGGLVHAAVDVDVAAGAPRRVRGAHEGGLRRQRILHLPR